MITTFGGLSFQTSNTSLANSSTWQQLVTSPTPCSRVRISAPTTTTNGNTISVIAQTAGKTPVGTNIGEFALPSSASGLNYVLVGDASLIWIYGTAGDKVNYSIEG